MGYQLQWEPSGLVKRFFGHVTGEEFTAASVQTGADARFDDLHYIIIDLLGCDDHSVTAKHMEDVHALDRGAAYSNQKIRLAIVAAQEPILKLARDYASSPVSIYPTQVFTALDPARAWALGS